VNTYGYVYMTTNLINGKRYIGQHAYSVFNENYKGSGTYLTNAIKKYGVENFKTELIEWCETQEKLDERERYWIAYYNAVESDDFYNLATGGINGNPRKGTKFSLEARKKMSSRVSGAGNPMYGKNHTENSRKKISENHANFKGEHSPSYNRIAINDGIKIKYVRSEDLERYLSKGWIIGITEERKQIQSKSFKGRKHTEDYKKKQSERMSGKNNPMYGRKASKETKSLMTQQRLGRRWINNGKENKFVKPDDLESLLNEGWVLGKLVNLSTEIRKKQGESGKGKVWINNGAETIRIMPEFLESYFLDGWVLGLSESYKNKISVSRLGKKQSLDQIKARSKTFKGRIWINNGIENKWVQPMELENYLSNGYVKGKLVKGKAS